MSSPYRVKIPIEGGDAFIHDTSKDNEPVVVQLRREYFSGPRGLTNCASFIADCMNQFMKWN